MIDIPLGKALVPVEYHGADFDGTNFVNCRDIGCCLIDGRKENCGIFCHSEYRKDGKNVIFKLVDYPVGCKQCETCVHWDEHNFPSCSYQPKEKK